MELTLSHLKVHCEIRHLWSTSTMISTIGEEMKARTHTNTQLLVLPSELRLSTPTALP